MEINSLDEILNRKLRDCPFCGKGGEYIGITEYLPCRKKRPEYDGGGFEYVFTIFCGECGFNFLPSASPRSTPEEAAIHAIHAWNRRPSRNEGRWILEERDAEIPSACWWRCSSCGNRRLFYHGKSTVIDTIGRYCSNCGAKMSV